MPGKGLLITPFQDTVVVNFQQSSILDAAMIESIQKDLFVLVDEQARRRMILDFREVRMLSSQMLGCLVTLHKKAVAIRGHVILANLRPELMKVFTITRLDKVLEFAANEADAFKKLGLTKA